MTMPSYYSVIQYVPDLVKDERINIGVVAFDERCAVTYFIENWSRVRQFGGNVASLRNLAKHIGELTPATLKTVMDSWQESIRFTKPAASLLNPDSLLIDVAKRCLIDPEQPVKEYRNRQQAVAVMKEKLSGAFEQEIGKAGKKLLRTDYHVHGRLDKHEFDVAAVNGQPFFVADSLSFEIPENKDLVKLVHSVAWDIDDIKHDLPDFPLAIVALPPKKPSQLYDNAMRTFAALGADIILENKLTDWSRRMATNISAALKGKARL
jgi:hypothetical protein